MIVPCPSCQKKFRVEDKHFAGKERFSFKCPACGGPIEAVKASEANPAGEVLPTTQKLRRIESTWTEADVPEAELLALPSGKRISVAVLQGADSGNIFPATKPLLLIGRTDSDINLNDSEVSRHHARIEIKGLNVQLRDLKSTNGTYLNEQRITVTNLSNQSEFRVGATTLMLILTDEME